VSDFRTGYGASWLDFLATRIGRYQDAQRELLPDLAALRAFLAEHDLTPAEAPTARDVELARELREALHGAAVAAVRGDAPAAAAVREIESALTADRPLRIRRSAAGLRAQRPDSPREALARLARAAVEVLAGPERGLLRACGDDTCAGIFLDHGGRRRWCSDERCGNRARVRAHRARAKGEG